MSLNLRGKVLTDMCLTCIKWVGGLGLSPQPLSLFESLEMFAENLSLYLSLFPLWWFYRLLFVGLFTLAGPSGGGDPATAGNVDMDDADAVYGNVEWLLRLREANSIPGVSISAVSDGAMGLLQKLLDGYEKRLPSKAVFSWGLANNGTDGESELDNQVRRALKKSAMVFYDGLWYFTALGTHELLDGKAGVQMRNFGVDFLFFGNAWDFAGFGAPEVHRCGYTLKVDDALSRSEIVEICKEIRRGCDASWAFGVRLVSGTLRRCGMIC